MYRSIFNTICLFSFVCIGFSQERPNILFIISDDQSFSDLNKHVGNWLRTPNIDKLAKEGVLFKNAFVSAPSCAPSRLSILTGRHFFQNQEGAVHGSFIPNKFPLFTYLLEDHGYYVGYTGKGCGPFHKAKDSELAITKDPYGIQYNKIKIVDIPILSNGNIDYFKNFKKFLNDRKKGQPFCFHFNSWEPHRPYLDSAAYHSGYNIQSINVPAFMPDVPRVRSDIAEYAFEVNYFDHAIGEMIDFLKQEKLYDNTIIIVTSDNGMPFPNAKMHCYEYGHHVPLALIYPKKYPKQREIENLILIPQLAPTLLKEVGIPIPSSMTMDDILPILKSSEQGIIFPYNEFIVWGKEKHNPARENNLGYPIRALRTTDFLYVHNFCPERWPAGDPPYYKDFIWEGSGLPEVAMRYEVQNQTHPIIGGFLKLHTQKRPEDELFNIINDPYCLINLAENKNYNNQVLKMKQQLMKELKRLNDPRINGDGECFESAPTTFVNPKDDNGNPIFKNFPEKGEYTQGMKKFDHSRDKTEAIELAKTAK